LQPATFDFLLDAQTLASCLSFIRKQLSLIRSVLLTLYTVWVVFVFTSVMILFLPGFLIPPLFGPRGVSVTHFFIKGWSWIFSFLNRIPYKIIDRDKIVPGRSYIFVSNHNSYMDIPPLVVTMRGQFRALAKKELLKLPVFGWIANVMCVTVDRSSNESRRKSLDHLKEILDLGISVLIFPEGTQNRTNEKLQPFYDGAFRIAIETQEPVMPIIVLGPGTILPPGKKTIRPGSVRVIVGDAIPTTGLGLGDVKALKEDVFAKMSGMIDKWS
jgi:1-acyl-sn-glycerol-3-phosphate acyltransferase